MSVDVVFKAHPVKPTITTNTIGIANGYKPTRAVSEYLPGGGLCDNGVSHLNNGGAILNTGNESYLRDFMKGRHLGAVNIMCADGHVESVPGKILGEDFYTNNNSYCKGFFAMWNKND